MKTIINIFNDFLNLIYPQLCEVCDDVLVYNEKLFCTNCLSELPKTNFVDYENNMVAKMFWGRVEIDYATSLFYFFKGSKYRVLLHKLKYKGIQEIGVELGKMLGGELLNTQFSSIDVIVPLPLHKRRLISRGYNQSSCITQGISEVLNKPVNETDVVRNIFNITQTGKGRIERWENVKDIFEVKNKDSFKNKIVLLVDDIITTGATIEACAQVLLKIEGVRVYVCSLAVTET